MKKFIVIDEIAICFVSAVGYGFGFFIPDYFGCSYLVSLIICFASGFAIEYLAEIIIFSKFIQISKFRRLLVEIGCIFIFIIGSLFSLNLFDTNLNRELEEEFAFVLGIPLVSLTISFIAFQIKKRGLIRKYGSGNIGYLFSLKSQTFIQNLNKTNRPIVGQYNTKNAVKTKTGTYVGKRNFRTISFLGIPYAKPPVGENRWKKPIPLESSDTIHEAFYFGPSAPQAKHKGNILNFHQQSEDCLYLNIWKSSSKKIKNSPVLVYLHDGDYTYGGSANPVEEGTAFVKKHKDIIFVSLNYRLGVLGFIDFSDIPGGEKYPDAINCGILDQIEALKWIKENISAFGGDPNNITLMGAGSGGTTAILLSNITKNLFKKVIVMSCAPEFVRSDNISSKKLGKMVAKEFKAKTMQDLLKIPTGDLKKAMDTYYLEGNTPSCDGKLIKQDLYKAFEKNSSNNPVKYLIGLPKNEISNLKAVIGNNKTKQLIDNWQTDFFTQSDKLMREKIYNKFRNISLGKDNENSTITQITNFFNYIYAPLFVASNLSDNKNQVNCFLWDVTPNIKHMQANALSFISTILDNFIAGEEFGYINDKNLKKITQTFLIKFLKDEQLQLYNNEIIGIKAFKWPNFNRKTKTVVSLNQKKITVIKDFYAEEIEIIKNAIDVMENIKK